MKTYRQGLAAEIHECLKALEEANANVRRLEHRLLQLAQQATAEILADPKKEPKKEPTKQ